MVNVSQSFHVRTWKGTPWFYWFVGLASLLMGFVVEWICIYLSSRHALPIPLSVCLAFVGLFFFVLSLGSLRGKRWVLGCASTGYILLGLCLWFLVFIPTGALESSPTWTGVAIAMLLNVPFVIAAISYYGIGVLARKKRANRNRRGFRIAIISSGCLLLLPFVVAAGMYVNDRVGHSVGLGLTFAYRESHRSMDTSGQTLVYATDTTPDELVKKFSHATRTTSSLSLPNIKSDIGTYAMVTIADGGHVHTMLFCNQSSPGCKLLLTKGRPFGGAVYAKKYIVTMDNKTYQFLHYTQW